MRSMIAAIVKAIAGGPGARSKSAARRKSTGFFGSSLMPSFLVWHPPQRLPNLRLDSLPDSFPYGPHRADCSNANGEDRANDELASLECHAVILAAD
jgi:hypothetical protein